MSRADYLLRIGQYRRGGDAHERGTAKLMNGRAQPGSGSLPNPMLKEDVVSKHFLVQNKMTLKGSYSFQKKAFDLTTDRALMMNKCPAWVLNIAGTELAVVRLEDLVAFLNDAGAR